MIKFDTKTFKTNDQATHENISSFLLLLIKTLYEEVSGIMAAEIFDLIDDDCEYAESTEFDVYSRYFCVRDMKREDNGVITRHGIVNSIHPFNTHAYNCMKQPPIIPNVPLHKDGRSGRYTNDYFFELEVVDEDEERIGSYLFVLNSARLSKLLKLYAQMQDPTSPIPKKITI